MMVSPGQNPWSATKPSIGIKLICKQGNETLPDSKPSFALIRSNNSENLIVMRNAYVQQQNAPAFASDPLAHLS
jgi:hypothetical protein